MLNTISCNLNMFCGTDFNALFIFLIPFLLIVLSNEYLDKKTKWPREIHRKYGHILSGLTIIFASFHLAYVEMILFSCALIIGALATRILKFKTVHQVKRKSVGTVLFALVTLLLTVIWFREHPELLRYGIWILVVPDAAAAVFGSLHGKQIPRFKKSILGSIVFFVGMILITVFYTQSAIPIIAIAFIMTTIEFFTRWGLDNLTMPLLGSYLIYLVM